MTKKQKDLYWANISKLKKVAIERGFCTKETFENYRHEITEKALGKSKSSKHFSNADLDRVLSAIWAITNPGDLNKQLRQIDQDFRRFEHHAKGLIRAAKSVPENAINSYFISICNKVGKNTPENLTKQQQNSVIAALNYNYKRSLSKPK